MVLEQCGSNGGRGGLETGVGVCTRLTRSAHAQDESAVRIRADACFWGSRVRGAVGGSDANRIMRQHRGNHGRAGSAIRDNVVHAGQGETAIRAGLPTTLSKVLFELSLPARFPLCLRVSGSLCTPGVRLRRPVLPIDIACRGSLLVGFSNLVNCHRLQKGLVLGHLLVRIELPLVVSESTPPDVDAPGRHGSHQSGEDEHRPNSRSGEPEETRPGAFDAARAASGWRIGERTTAPMAGGQKPSGM